MKGFFLVAYDVKLMTLKLFMCIDLTIDMLNYLCALYSLCANQYGYYSLTISSPALTHYVKPM